MENLWAKKEKAEELKEVRKKERNDVRLPVETRRLELKHENRRLDLQQQELALKQRNDDEKIINMDLRGMSERQQKFYMDMQDEIITRRFGGGAS
uniref:No apical meristem-associated C-terminal domain-containing protein n=1 Tax=Setaria italica TaxID=4555 RepID=K3YD86_SETIT